MSPMYIAGRLRTASNPSSTWMLSAEYFFDSAFFFSLISMVISLIFRGSSSPFHWAPKDILTSGRCRLKTQ